MCSSFRESLVAGSRIRRMLTWLGKSSWCVKQRVGEARFEASSFFSVKVFSATVGQHLPSQILVLHFLLHLDQILLMKAHLHINGKQSQAQIASPTPGHPKTDMTFLCMAKMTQIFKVFGIRSCAQTYSSCNQYGEAITSYL